MITISNNDFSAKYALAGAAIVAIARQAFIVGKAIYHDRTSDYLRYNKLGNGLAMDNLSDDILATTPITSPTPLLFGTIQSTNLVVAAPTSVTVSTPSTGNYIRNGMEIEMTPVKEKRHRRIGTHKKHNYASDVIAECRVRFGCPINNPANRMAVRRYSMNLMYAHGLRPTHVCRVIDDIVEMVFHESDELKRSRRLRTSWFGRVFAFLGINPSQSS